MLLEIKFPCRTHKSPPVKSQRGPPLEPMAGRLRILAAVPAALLLGKNRFRVCLLPSISNSVSSSPFVYIYSPVQVIPLRLLPPCVLVASVSIEMNVEIEEEDLYGTTPLLVMVFVGIPSGSRLLLVPVTDRTSWNPIRWSSEASLWQTGVRTI